MSTLYKFLTSNEGKHAAHMIVTDDDDNIVHGLDAENQSGKVRMIRTKLEEDLSTTAETKRINRQSVISNASSSSSDISSFHTTSSTSSSSYSYTDLSIGFNSVPTITTSSLSVSPNLPKNLCRLPKTTPKGREPDKRYFFAYEMYTTERDYVDVLTMLTKEFRDAIQGIVPNYFIQKFFRPLDAVLSINRRLLDDLEKRVLVDWDDNPRVSDIIRNICPYLKQYSIYVRKFESLNLMLDGMQTDSPHFHEVLMRFQALDRCKKLSIKNYLLKPIQRLPQYPLLLHGYIKQLSPDNPDYEETKRAHKVVTEVVEHINRESLMGQNSMQLNDLKNRIITRSPDAIVKPGRELIKQGMLYKLSRKDIQERYFILFNDVLFYLMPVMNEMLRLNEELPLDGMEVQISNQADNEFMIRSFKRSFALMAYDSIERQEWVDVLEKTISEHEAKCSFKAARMHANTGVSERPEVSAEVISRRSSLPSCRPSVMSKNDSKSCSDSFPENDVSLFLDKKLHQQSSIQSNNSNGTVERRSSHMTSLGERAPVLVHDRRVTMCQRCTRTFSFISRRHHCRACGCVVCTDCSSKTYPLKYRRFEAQRVCDVCFSQLTHQHPEWWSEAKVSTTINPNHALSNADIGMIGQKCRSNSYRSSDCITADGSPSTPPDQNHNPSATLNLNFIRNKYRNSFRAAKNIPAVLCEVWANDSTCNMSGFMYRLSVSKKWKRYWFLIKSMVLYTYRASEDVAALETLPLPGYIVTTSKESIKGFHASSIIELSHPGRSTIYFHPETPQTHERWLKAFEEASSCNNLSRTSLKSN